MTDRPIPIFGEGVAGPATTEDHERAWAYHQSQQLPVITYKPGWTFTWEPESCLAVHVEGPDCNDGEISEVDWHFTAPSPFDSEWLRQRIAGIEDHETREWLRIDGVKVFDPHLTGAPHSGRLDGGR